MDFLKVQLDRIQQQLAGLNATQKMLTVALVAIMVITVVWWGKYAGEAEMVPLLSQSLSVSELGRMQNTLQERGIEGEIVADKLLVHSDKRLAAMSALTFAKALPRLTDDGLEKMLNQMNPFDPIDKSNKLWNEHKQAFLSQVIGGMKGVAAAHVIIDPTSRRGIGGDDIQPRASIDIQLEDGVKEAQNFTDAAAAFVMGAQAGLTPNHIAVIVNGQPQRVHDPQSDELASGSDQLKLLRETEAYEEQKIKDEYPYVRLAVKVTVTLNTTTIQEEKTQYDSKGVIQKANSSTEENDETSGLAQQAGGEAGAVPNIGLQGVPAQAAASGSGQTHTKTEQKFTLYAPQTRTVSHTPAGSATVSGAAVQVPRSFFVRLYKSENTGGKEPAQADLQPLITAKLGEMKKTVAMLCMLPSDKISIDYYPDIAEEANVQPAMASSVSSVSTLVSGHAKEVALGALAVMSLFMASMMVRKGTPAVVPVTAAPAPKAPTALLSTEPVAGEAAGGDGLLDGMELNEETIKAQQMVEQVSTMVRENPDAAAGLVKRWLNK